MPIGRIVLKSISESKKLSRVKSDGARLLYTWLIPHVDINGCFSADPLVVNTRIFTRLGKTNDEVKGYLQELKKENLIVIYKANGDDFLCLPDFEDKQPQLRPEREAKPSIPRPTPDQLRRKSGVPPHKLNQIKVNKDKSKEVKPEGANAQERIRELKSKLPNIGKRLEA